MAYQVEHRRNNSAAAIVMLVGAVIVGFGSTADWANLDVGSFSHEFDFKQTVLPDGSVTNLQSVLHVVAGIVAVCALLLIVTRIRGLGALWRLIALGAASIVAFELILVWKVVNDPTILGETYGHDLGGHIGGTLGRIAISLAHDAHLFDVTPGAGLWATTAGTGLILIGALIPAARSRIQASTGPAAPMIIYAPPPAWGYGVPTYPAPRISSADDGSWGPTSYQ